MSLDINYTLAILPFLTINNSRTLCLPKLEGKNNQLEVTKVYMHFWLNQPYFCPWIRDWPFTSTPGDNSKLSHRLSLAHLHVSTLFCGSAILLLFHVAKDVEGGKIVTKVKYSIITVIDRTDDLCEQVHCPLKSGKGSLSTKEKIPGDAPSVSEY